ncbi:hypothetical protein KsCSTR_40740 [Candidatus Kuenenia stuttgartiensis]|uniref:Uncharacterized protein n=1 Tax=Kuenenia stuttgartiensis TaxID=174633 RepID=Q1Q7K1_KUEST|nr:hypothetical protein KsCSTR_40740 [Candidatus Kuenenia stuttgartiensis]CAJ70797.1 unknown protein [Candidatus Kuenenia stuttgartiensis]
MTYPNLLVFKCFPCLFNGYNPITITFVKTPFRLTSRVLVRFFTLFPLYVCFFYRHKF